MVFKWRAIYQFTNGFFHCNVVKKNVYISYTIYSLTVKALLRLFWSANYLEIFATQAQSHNLRCEWKRCVRVCVWAVFSGVPTVWPVAKNYVYIRIDVDGWGVTFELPLIICVHAYFVRLDFENLLINRCVNVWMWNVCSVEIWMKCEW